MTAKKWILTYLLTTFIPLLCISPLVPFVDPYMHYHKPFTERFFYRLKSGMQRYVNNGITRNFDYDALITGTSMTENFKSSEFDELFGCRSIKVPFSGGSFFEINRNQEQAFKNHAVRYMLRSLDAHRFRQQIKYLPETAGNPAYLYNDSVLDDLNYLWNKDAVQYSFLMLIDGLRGEHGITEFDKYSNWMSGCIFGGKQVLKGRTEFRSPTKMKSLKDKGHKQITESIRQNVIQLALEHPECEFYYFFPPYSIVEWGEQYESGTLERKLQEEELVIQLILQCDNIHLFSFNTKYEWILNLDN